MVKRLHFILYQKRSSLTGLATAGFQHLSLMWVAKQRQFRRLPRFGDQRHVEYYDKVCLRFSLNRRHNSFVRGSRTQWRARQFPDTGWWDGPVVILHLFYPPKAVVRCGREESEIKLTRADHDKSTALGLVFVFLLFLPVFVSPCQTAPWPQEDHSHEPEVHRLQERRRAAPLRHPGGGEPAVWRRWAPAQQHQRRRGGGACSRCRGGGAAER